MQSTPFKSLVAVPAHASWASAFASSEAPFRFRAGARALLISMPHVGTCVPPALAARFTDEARQVPDTDWHLERLYDFADELAPRCWWPRIRAT